MSRIDALLQPLRRVYGDGPETSVAQQLLQYLVRYHDTRHVTVPLVRGLVPGAEQGKLDVSIVRVLQYLAGEQAAVLKLSFEYIDEQDVPHTLEPSEVRAAMESMINPLSGEVDEKIASRLLAYFDPQSERIEQLSSGGPPQP
jgi:hypothetical protein